MSDIIDLSCANEDTPELKIHPAGTEIRARITNITKGENKNGIPYIMPWFEDPEDVYVEDFSDYIELPAESDLPKVRIKKINKLKDFARAFDLDLFVPENNLDLFVPEYNLEDAKGATGWIILGIGKNQDGSPCNRPNKYVVNN